MKYSLVTILLASILLGGCWLVDESKFVLTHPQSVYPLKEPTGVIDEIIVNGKNWPIDKQKIQVVLNDPRKQLAGVAGASITTGYSDDKENFTFSLGIHIPQSINTFDQMEAGIDIQIDDLLYKSLYAEEQYSTNLYEDCPLNNGRGYSGPDKAPVLRLVPRIPIILEQRTKHVTLKGIFDIAPTEIPRYPYMICDSKVNEQGFLETTTPLYRNPAPPAIVEVRGIHLDIDTDLIFRWCDKGGKCYEK